MPKLEVSFEDGAIYSLEKAQRGCRSGAGALDLTPLTHQLTEEMAGHPTSNEYGAFLRRKLKPEERLQEDIPALEDLYIERFNINPLHGFLCFRLGIEDAEEHIVSAYVPPYRFGLW